MSGVSKAAFFPWPLFEDPTSVRKPVASGPESKIQGKSLSQPLPLTLLFPSNLWKPSSTTPTSSSTTSIPEKWGALLAKKGFFAEAPALYHHCKLKMTFEALDTVSTRMAKHLGKVLKEKGVSPNTDGDIVAALLFPESGGRDERVVTLILAFLKLGITYMPLPDGREAANDISWAVSLTKPAVIVFDKVSPALEKSLGVITSTTSVMLLSFEDIWTNCRIDHVTLDKESLALEVTEPDEENPGEDGAPCLGGSTINKSGGWKDIPAFEKTVAIFFTHGSVSSPHAVRVGCREIYNRIHWESKVFPCVPSDAYALTTSLTDPRSIIQILVPLLQGKPLTIIDPSDLQSPDKLCLRITEVKLSRITLSPPKFEAILDYVAKADGMKKKLSSITHWTISGSALKLETGKKFFRLFSGVYKQGVFLISMYGTTETLGEATFEVFFNLDDLEKKIGPGFGKLSSGVPIEGTTIGIIDRFDQTLPLGQRGEVVISGACLASGGYSGFSSGHSAFSPKTRKGAKGSTTSLLFRTGDLGRVLTDSLGVKRLYVEGRLDNEVIVTGGEAVNLQQWVGEVLHTKMVKDAALLTYHRGRDSQVVVAAVVLKEGLSCVDVLEKINSRRGFMFKSKSSLPTVFSVDKIPKTESGHVDKKLLRVLFRKVLIECDESEWESLELSEEEAGVARFLCRIMALSTGLPLVHLIRKLSSNFWDIGGTPLNAVILLKMARDHGYHLKMRDFVAAATIRDLIDIVRQTEKNFDPDQDDVTADLRRTESVALFGDKIRIGPIAAKDLTPVVVFLMQDCPPHALFSPQEVMKYWREVVQAVLDKGLCLMAKMGSQVVGVAITGDWEHSHLLPSKKTISVARQTPPPRDIIYGLELLETCISMSKNQLWRKISGPVARCLFLGVCGGNVEPGPGGAAAAPTPILTPGEKVVLVEELLSQTVALANSKGFSSLVLSTANPLVQEVGIHLGKWIPILEFPVSRFRARDGTRPFTYTDDNHASSVLVKNMGKEGDEDREGDSAGSGSGSGGSLSTVSTSSQHQQSSSHGLGGNHKM